MARGRPVYIASSLAKSNGKPFRGSIVLCSQSCTSSDTRPSYKDDHTLSVTPIARGGTASCPKQRSVINSYTQSKQPRSMLLVGEQQQIFMVAAEMCDC